MNFSMTMWNIPNGLCAPSSTFNRFAFRNIIDYLIGERVGRNAFHPLLLQLCIFKVRSVMGVKCDIWEFVALVRLCNHLELNFVAQK